jgi:hypothetical protein
MAQRKASDDDQAQPADVKGTVNVSQPDDKGAAGGRTDGPIVVDEGALPAEADKTSSPNPNDAKLEDPPVRTTRPDVPIAASSAVGAGQHVPPDPELYDEFGRPRLDKDQG